ncbi:hypothetical protein Lal_00007269 [Lupinus albus]|uniref:Putative transcription factor C2H2 family n=1 Tax=Lupinus albus TaxID=3870 RepID=A0A6A5MW95_LUPAL|nr:putative transcription factor C2H2 family [Lupinus albus]KAF1874655.1 hypothetical protein Lal_00007269 [Lupinus albus]
MFISLADLRYSDSSHHINNTMEERNFVCKYCSKRFLCGKSLGGHIRTHITEERNNNKNNNAAECDNFKFDAAIRRKKKKDLWSEDGYGLRENPKKTVRSVNSNATLEQQQQQEEVVVVEKFCKECGKGFSSLKALCGHMACHSQKQKKLVLDSESDTEEICDVSKNPRRSKRMRFKTISLGNNQSYSSSVPLVNGSSSVSEVEQEQEEVARCLMLLSKDSSHKGPFALVTESSENNSIVVEAAKASHNNMRICIKNGNKFVSNGYDSVENNVLKLKSIDNSDSGYYTYGLQTKMAKSDVSNDEFKAEFENYNAESRKMLSMNEGISKYTVRKLDSRNIANYDSFGHSKKDTEYSFANDEIYETSGKGWNYESLAYDSTEESDESSSDTDSFPVPKSHSNKVFNGKKTSKAKKKSKKSKEFECPICYKIFKSGQALGGHKRSHFVGGSEETSVIINQSLCLIDLNLPAPVDE